MTHSEAFDDAAVDGEVGALGAHGVEPGGQVALEAVADAGDLVVAALEEAPGVVGGIELEGLELLEGVGGPAHLLGHREVEAFAQRGFETGGDLDFLLVLMNGLEGADVGVHVGEGDDPVQLVVGVGIGVVGQAKFLAPAAQEAAQKKSLMGTRSGS